MKKYLDNHILHLFYYFRILEFRFWALNIHIVAITVIY